MNFFKSWLIHTFVSLILCALAGGVAGFIIGFVMGGAGAPLDQIRVVCGIAGFLAGLPISFLVFRWAVGLYFAPKQIPTAQFPTSEYR
jgi:ABC-type uncharacterized transport system permease subunit